MIPGSGRSDGEGIGYPLQYSGASLVIQMVESACNEGDLGLIPGLGIPSGEGNGSPLQYSGLEMSMERLQATVLTGDSPWGAKSWT